MIGILIKEGDVETYMHIGETPRGDKCSNCKNASPSQGTPKIAKKILETRWEEWKQFIALYRKQICGHFDFELLQNVEIINKSLNFVLLFYSNAGNTITTLLFLLLLLL